MTTLNRLMNGQQRIKNNAEPEGEGSCLAARAGTQARYEIYNSPGRIRKLIKFLIMLVVERSRRD